MNRTVPVIALLVTIPVALLGVRVWQQNVASHGPSGGSGVIEGTEVSLSARVSARVAEIPVRVGQTVKAGDVLLRLDCSDTEATLAEGRARLAAARAQAIAARAQADAAKGGAGAAKAVSDAGRSQAEAVAKQRDLARRQVERVQKQAEDLAPSALDQASSTADALLQQAEAAASSARASILQAKMASGQASAAEANAAAAEEAVRAGEALVSRAEMLAKECVVTAPLDGVVQMLPWDVGELAPLGSSLVKLVDLHEVKVTFYLPDAELGAAAPGGEAEVVADAWPDQTFKGRVNTVSATAEFTPRNIQTRTDRDRLVFPVEITIPNPDSRLRPGMPVQVVLPGTER